ncbi:MAG: hypothetical protein COB12_06200 [Flavobacterium sp.]|nr:MAG: hypothetical protein COB12_06200 [Flavobacterium sp.]
MSCNSNEKKEVVSQEISKKETLVVTPTKQVVSTSNFEIVENEKVCMVNDRYMTVKQIPIEADGTIYWGCCENCVKKLQENIAGVRNAKDPITGNEVDKANAVIVQNKENGVVFYFESKSSAEKFIASNS